MINETAGASQFSILQNSVKLSISSDFHSFHGFLGSRVDACRIIILIFHLINHKIATSGIIVDCCFVHSEQLFV